MSFTTNHTTHLDISRSSGPLNPNRLPPSYGFLYSSASGFSLATKLNIVSNQGHSLLPLLCLILNLICPRVFLTPCLHLPLLDMDISGIRPPAATTFANCIRAGVVPPASAHVTWVNETVEPSVPSHLVIVPFMIYGLLVDLYCSCPSVPTWVPAALSITLFVIEASAWARADDRKLWSCVLPLYWSLVERLAWT